MYICFDFISFVKAYTKFKPTPSTSSFETELYLVVTFATGLAINMLQETVDAFMSQDRQSNLDRTPLFS